MVKCYIALLYNCIMYFDIQCLIVGVQNNSLESYCKGLWSNFVPCSFTKSWLEPPIIYDEGSDALITLCSRIPGRKFLLESSSGAYFTELNLLVLQLFRLSQKSLIQEKRQTKYDEEWLLVPQSFKKVDVFWEISQVQLGQVLSTHDLSRERGTLYEYGCIWLKDAEAWNYPSKD